MAAMNDVDAFGPVVDTSSGGSAWKMLDHWENQYGWRQSPAFTRAKATDILGAAKIQNRSQWNTAVEAAVGSTWWNGRSNDWKDYAYAGTLELVAAMP